jgi:hypothetical protein
MREIKKIYLKIKSRKEGDESPTKKDKNNKLIKKRIW